VLWIFEGDGKTHMWKQNEDCKERLNECPHLDYTLSKDRITSVGEVENFSWKRVNKKISSWSWSSNLPLLTSTKYASGHEATPHIQPNKILEDSWKTLSEINTGSRFPFLTFNKLTGWRIFPAWRLGCCESIYGGKKFVRFERRSGIAKPLAQISPEGVMVPWVNFTR
jgi:hypothetical protein